MQLLPRAMLSNRLHCFLEMEKPGFGPNKGSPLFSWAFLEVRAFPLETIVLNPG